MSRIFVTGDTHGTIDFQKLTVRRFPIQKELNKSDILIVCGDGGLCWSGGDDDKWLQQWYEDKNFTTLIIDGNHENHVLISKLPVIEKFEGKVHQISNSVFYAIRGEVYKINKKKILTCGGADSHDKEWRTEGKSWWPQEQITEAEIDNALENLAIHNFQVDYIISHTGGSEVCKQLGFMPTISDELFDKILEATKYDKHYCGHYHVNKWIDKSRVLYKDIIEIK